jgi:hypothetical protein
MEGRDSEAAFQSQVNDQCRSCTVTGSHAWGMGGWTGAKSQADKNSRSDHQFCLGGALWTPVIPGILPGTDPPKASVPRTTPLAWRHALLILPPSSPCLLPLARPRPATVLALILSHGSPTTQIYLLLQPRPSVIVPIDVYRLAFACTLLQQYASLGGRRKEEGKRAAILP